MMAPGLSGTTTLVGLIGDPVGHVRTPQLFNRLFRERGVDAVCIALHASSERLDRVIAGLAGLQNLAGCVVTIPHKVEAGASCDRLGPAAALCGSVNAIRREPDGTLVGETFDGAGFVAGLRAAGVEIESRSVLLVGAGGAAASIAFALAAAGVATLQIVNRSLAAAESLAVRLRRAFPSLASTAAERPGLVADLVVNATPLGSREGDPSPVPGHLIHSGACVAEALISARPTLLAETARRQGATTIGGEAMLMGQVELLLRHILPEAATLVRETAG